MPRTSDQRDGSAACDGASFERRSSGRRNAHAEVHSAANAHRVPSVIRLLAYRHIPQQSRALFARTYCCGTAYMQFCGSIFPSSELTLDHVVPRSRGGRSSWENLVACCYRCNNSKGDRTPEEAGFKLARRPRPFTLHTSRQLMRMIGHRDERWRKYLFINILPRFYNSKKTSISGKPFSRGYI